MQMITRCPACCTLFKVVPDQLRIANGWVRCGQCMAAFEAQANMLPVDPDAPRDLRWREQARTQGNPQRSGDEVAKTEPRVTVDTAEVNVWATTEPWPESRAAEIAVFNASAFESAASLASQESVFSHEFVEVAPVDDAAQGPVARQDPVEPVASELPSVSMPTDEEMERQHAELLATLARLRQKAERLKREQEVGLHGETPGDMDQDDAWDSQHSPERETAIPGADPDSALDGGREREHGRQREDRLRSKERARARIKTRNRNREPEQEEQDWDHSRLTIDFVLSEIGQLSSASESPRRHHGRPRRKPESKSAPPKQDAPSFVKQAQRRAFWDSPGIRAGLWMTAGGLAVLLAAQIAVNQRDRLAAQHPGMASLLQTLCHPMICRIAPWRKLDAVAIDSSNFVRTGPQSFNFTVMLRNGGATPVAMPALELSLIDTQDQPLVRRVLNPADWGAPPQLAAHGQSGGAALLTVLDAADPQAISGYRVTAFYP